MKDDPDTPAAVSGRARGGIELRVRMSTLLGRDQYPAEIAGWGPVHAELARDLLPTLTRGQWRYAITNDDGHLTHAGTTRARPTGSPPGTGRTRDLVELQIPATLLTELTQDTELDRGRRCSPTSPASTATTRTPPHPALTGPLRTPAAAIPAPLRRHREPWPLSTPHDDGWKHDQTLAPPHPNPNHRPRNHPTTPRRIPHHSEPPATSPASAPRPAAHRHCRQTSALTLLAFGDDNNRSTCRSWRWRRLLTHMTTGVGWTGTARLPGQTRSPLYSAPVR